MVRSSTGARSKYMKPEMPHMDLVQPVTLEEEREPEHIDRCLPRLPAPEFELIRENVIETEFRRHGVAIAGRAHVVDHVVVVITGKTVGICERRLRTADTFRKLCSGFVQF